jgi:hypothetical protein
MENCFRQKQFFCLPSIENVKLLFWRKLNNFKCQCTDSKNEDLNCRINLSKTLKVLKKDSTRYLFLINVFNIRLYILVNNWGHFCHKKACTFSINVIFRKHNFLTLGFVIDSNLWF